jgi:4-amino-4-deoxy-L-arabinose transferase-like glycosyltransferase
MRPVAEGNAGVNCTGSSSIRYRQFLFYIILLSLFLRGAVAVYSETHPAEFDLPDSHRYVRVARNIASGNGPIDQNTQFGEFRTEYAGTDPLYPTLVAGGILTGATTDAAIMRWARVINALLSLLSIGLLAELARRLFDEKTALISALIFAVDPILLYFNGLILTESTYIFFLLLTAYFLVRFVCGPGMLWIVASGIAAGMGTLTRSTNLLLPIVLIISSVLLLRSSSTRWRRLMLGAAPVFLLSYGLTLLPEALRKHRVLGQFVVTRTGSGASLLEGLGPWADGGPGMDRIQYPPVSAQAGEIERDEIFRRTALTWARSHPWETLRLALTKLSRTWALSVNAPDYQGDFYRIASLASTIPVFALAIMGLCRLRNRRELAALLLLPAAYFSLIHMIFVGSIRYRLPAMPFLFVLAAHGACRFFRCDHEDAAGRLHAADK